MANIPPRNRLLVEGTSDRGAIAEIIEKNGIPWKKNRTGNFPVDIKNCGSDDKVLNDKVINTELKQSELEALGLIVDADQNPMGRWDSVKHMCKNWAVDIPKEIPKNGFICPVHNTAGKQIRFGIWIMPDNQNPGMLENFLANLVADQNLWKYAEEVVKEAKQKGGTFKDVHTAKANIHTWLAWHDEPGMGFGVAIAKKHLDPCHSNAEAFVRWFKELYQLEFETSG